MQCFKGGGFLQQGELFRVAGRHHFEVHIHMPTFLNYQNARPEYGALRDGTKVMCQCRLGAPQDVLGPERDVSCGAVAVYPPLQIGSRVTADTGSALAATQLTGP